MLNSTIILKIKERLNKLDSADYDNIASWKIVEAFNKGQVEWLRRNLHGLNVKKEGDEQSKRRIDDLQTILNDTPVLAMTKKDTYYISTLPLPINYFEWKAVEAKATNECCPDPRPLLIYLAEEANKSVLLRDENKKPSFEFAETFATLKNNQLLIYTNGEFEIEDTILTYYRQPRRIEIAGIMDPYTGLIPAVDVISEFKDDIVELFCDEAAKIIAGDIESITQMQRNNQSVEGNN